MTGTVDRALLVYGTAQVEPVPRLLTAGRLTAKLFGGNLRSIAYDGVEVLRAISFLVRDKDWGTCNPDISDLVVDETADRFAVSYKARCSGPGGTVLDIEATITGTSAGNLTFAATAASPTGFQTNRCGFCILHPIVGVAGMPVTVEHVDGTVRDTHLPDLIEPWQPFMDMRAITHTVIPGVTAECRMEGDTFEMEDQRNWTDASYKTYVRPLALPWPYEIGKGEPIGQTISLVLRDERQTPPAASPAQSSDIRLTPGDRTAVLPAIGLVVTPEEAAASLPVLVRTGGFGAHDLLLHFDPLAGHGRGAIAAFADLAARHKGTVTLEIAVPCERPLAEELRDIATIAQEAGLIPDAVIVSPSVDRQSTPPGSTWPDCPPLEDVYAAARAAFPAVRLGGGMLSYFTEINRKRVPAQTLAFVSHATNPIVHAADDVSVMESLEALPFVTKSMRAIYGDKPYRIGPSTIAMRQNPYGSRTMENPTGGRIPMANRDPRHNALFGAAFALGYAAAVADAGLERLTLSALTGPFGLIAGPAEPMPDGGVRPLAHVVAVLSRMAGWTWRETVSSAPARLLALRGESADGDAVLLLANITAETLTADLSALAIPADASLSLLDETTVLAGATGAVTETSCGGGKATLLPYGIARIGWKNA